jgi:F-type H+-transporting ATPase subunit delta
MAHSKAADRYAKSLYQIAGSEGKQELVLKDMQQYREALKTSRDLKAVMDSPVIASSKKKGIVDAIFRPHFQHITGLFFDLVIRKGREKVLGDIADAYIREDKRMKGIKDGKLISATALTPELRQELQARAEKLAGSKVILEEKLDPSLLGGFILSVDDLQLDESIKSKLARLHHNLVDTSYIPKIDLI